ncbi:MAG: TRAP transporter small permease subunit [Rhizobiaceae bacterium]
MSPLASAAVLIDRVLSFIAKIGAWLGVVLVLVVCFDVVTRKLGVNKEQVFGFNSTQVQETEYWLHTLLFSLTLGWAYLRQSHVRIDLLRERLSLNTQYVIEILGGLFFLLPYSAIGIYYCSKYAYVSYLENEVSNSTIGLSHIWILKSLMPVMFLLLGLAAIAMIFKSIAGLMGRLPENMIAETVGGDH